MKKLFSVFTLLFFFSMSTIVNAGIFFDPVGGGGAAGNNIEDGSADGEMLFWDDTGNFWRHTELTELYWDDTLKRLNVVGGLRSYGLEMMNNNGIIFYNAAETDFSLMWQDPFQTNESLSIGLPASNRLLIYQGLDAGTNFGLANPLHPTWDVFSANAIAGQRLSGTHFGTHGEIRSYTGDLALRAAQNVRSQADLDIVTTVPHLNFKDDATVDGDINARIEVRATDTGSGTEDVDVILESQVAGALAKIIDFDADGAPGSGGPLLKIGDTGTLNIAEILGITDSANDLYGLHLANPDNAYVIGISNTDGDSNNYFVVTTNSNAFQEMGLNTPATDTTFCIFSNDDVSVPANRIKRFCFKHDGDDAVLFTPKGQLKLDGQTEIVGILNILTLVAGATPLEIIYDDDGTPIIVFSKNATDDAIFQLNDNTGSTKVEFNTDGTDNYLNAGSLAIGATSANASAALDIVSTSQGVLMPRMTNAQIQAISTPADGLRVHSTDWDMMMVYDSGRSKWLSEEVTTLQFGGGISIDNEYVPFNDANVSGSGPRMPFNGAITRITTQTAGGQADKGFEVHINGVSQLGYSLTAGVYTSTSINVNFSAGDYLHNYAVATGLAVADPATMIWVKWRL